MRLATILLLALPAFGQIQATYEPLAEAETKRTTGIKAFTLWNVTIESALPSVNRGDVEKLTAFTEIRPSMAEDLVRKSSGANSLTLLGKAWDGGAGFVATGLGIAGYAAQSKEMALAGGAVALVSMFRNLLKGQAPDGTMYLPEFMPDVMTCKAGYCGNWLVLTSKIGSPERKEVGSLEPIVKESLQFQPLTMPLPSREGCVTFGDTGIDCNAPGTVDAIWCSNGGISSLPPCSLSNCIPINGGACGEGTYKITPATTPTHRQVSEADEQIAAERAGWLAEAQLRAGMVRDNSERKAAAGVGQ